MTARYIADTIVRLEAGQSVAGPVDATRGY